MARLAASPSRRIDPGGASVTVGDADQRAGAGGDRAGDAPTPAPAAEPAPDPAASAPSSRPRWRAAAERAGSGRAGHAGRAAEPAGRVASRPRPSATSLCCRAPSPSRRAPRWRRSWASTRPSAPPTSAAARAPRPSAWRRCARARPCAWWGCPRAATGIRSRRPRRQRGYIYGQLIRPQPESPPAATPPAEATPKVEAVAAPVTRIAPVAPGGAQGLRVLPRAGRDARRQLRDGLGRRPLERAPGASGDPRQAVRARPLRGHGRPVAGLRRRRRLRRDAGDAERDRQLTGAQRQLERGAGLSQVAAARRPARATACRPRRNGSTPPAPGPRPATGGARWSARATPTARTAAAAGIARRRPRSAPSRPTRSACTT